MNLKDTAAAIATRFVGATATVDGVSEGIAVGPTASLPNTIGKGPALLVFHPSGVLDIGLGKMRRDELDFPVRFLRDPLNYPQRSDALYAWYDALRDLVEADMDLGLAYVSWARVISADVALDEGEYAGVQYDQIEFTVRVLFREAIATVAI